MSFTGTFTISALSARDCLVWISICIRRWSDGSEHRKAGCLPAYFFWFLCCNLTGAFSRPRWLVLIFFVAPEGWLGGNNTFVFGDATISWNGKWMKQWNGSEVAGQNKKKFWVKRKTLFLHDWQFWKFSKFLGAQFDSLSGAQDHYGGQGVSQWLFFNQAKFPHLWGGPHARGGGR